MEKEITVEIIRIVPIILWTFIFLLFVYVYRRRIGATLDRIGRIKAFGVEAEFAQAREQLIKASKSYDLSPDERDVNAIIKRADRIRELLNGSRILWVDDQYLANANIFRFLHAYGVVIDRASSTDEALSALKWAAGAFEVVVTDMVRGDDTTAGIDLINRMRDMGIRKSVIIFVAKLDPTRGVPAGARAITDSPIQLIDEIMNVLESDSR